ncbi:hypothetical protein PHLGIDRAFT_73330 [Phlebiopsis gigantea 11061_1 CR5-6]|uniref:PIN domain-containing protein n=1 Tax=Phlebiopsis gigantea (strain 11061_1 CR5-6) TaxID=745531 RepID=A0A0C3S996_PHLG1|nr:hypothetical protein PHLGIDRAFT_73330 [Phlebiopsis gigantea 11061_1 CR5-6]
MQDSLAIEPPATLRKGKGRPAAPQPTDFAEKLVALRRKQASLTKPKERAERPSAPSTSTSRNPAHPPSPRRTLAQSIMNPSIVVSQPSPHPDSTPDEHEFTRKLKIAPTSPRHTHSRAEHTSPRGSGKLYNPHAEPPRRQLVTAEPDAMSETASSSYAPRGPAPTASRNHHRSQPSGRSADAPRLFDPRKDDPHHFSVLPRSQAINGASPQNGRPTPTPKSSGDWMSASSTSSYAQSTISSNFTLNTTTTASSASSAIFDSGQPRSEDSAASSNALSSQLKNLYRSIIALEGKLSSPDRDVDMQDDYIYEDSHRLGFLQKVQPVTTTRTRQEEEAEQERYRKMIKEHKELAGVVHQLLVVTLSPSVPVSLRNIPIKYNLVSRLWLHAFHRLLESLRRAATSSAFPEIALENLVEFIYYAYTFYAGLMDEQNLAQFRNNWVECLGDIARYRMAVTALLESQAPSMSKTLPVNAVTRAALTSNQLATNVNTPEASALSDKPLMVSAVDSPMPRIDDSPPPSVGEQPAHHAPEFVPSVGIIAARMMELEPEKERWRQVSKEWYAKGLAFQPGSGKLHHHLGVLSRDREGDDKDELRAVYHFVKSMITLHPFSTSREAVLQIWAQPAQSRRQAPDATLTDLFVLLHGMIFTNIQLDDFKGVLARFEEKLLIEGALIVQERDWIMMAVINIGAMLEYGRSTAVLRRVSGVMSRDTIPGSTASPIMTNGGGKVKLMSKRTDGSDDKRMEVDDDGDDASHISGLRAMAISQPAPAPSDAAAATEPEIPLSLRSALQLTFAMLTHALGKPTLPQTSAVSHPHLNPYLTILLTFLATALKDKSAEGVLTRAIPWESLAAFLSSEMPRKIMFAETQRESPLLSSGCFPLAEDWCLRGLGWGGKKVYERGFWDKATRGEEKSLESEVLDKIQAADVRDGVIEDDAEDDEQQKYRAELRRAELSGRWIRVARAALKIAKVVGGFAYAPPPTKDLRGQWRIEGHLAERVARWREEERLEKLEAERRLRGTRWDEDEDDMDVDDEEHMGNDSDEDVSEEVKALKERLRYLSSFLQQSQQTPSKRQRAKAQRETGGLRMVPGYTTLVMDTNILLSSLPVFNVLVESAKWTVVVPLPVIMELDGLALDPSPLGEASKAASASIISHLRSHGLSLKVLTSKGNYLANLNIRTEQVDFDDGREASWERNMDDLILRAAMWQTEHWVDRSMFLKVSEDEQQVAGASKVALLTFDRMLRLKARSREVDAPSERDLASLLSVTP